MNPDIWMKIVLITIFLSGAIILASGQGSLETESKMDRIVETVEFVDADIIDVLRLLAAQNALNLIIGPDTMGVVSLRFSGVTLRSALDAILRSKGFQYTLYDNILMVSAPDSLERLRGLGLETEIIKLKYSDARDVKTMIDSAKVLSPWGYTTVYARSLKTEVLRASQVLSGDADPGDGSSISTRSDILIITDRPINITQIKDMIETIDIPVRQIQIDVFFVETILDENSNLGIDWQSVLSVEGSYRGKSDWVFGNNTGGNMVNLGSLARTQFRAVLDMMVTENRATLLSQPRITTLDNQPANIYVGVTVWIEERTTGGGGTTQDQITFIERQVPIELIVVPHIIYDDRIILEIQPRVEEITGWQEGVQGQQLPIISTRTADSRVEVRNGETVIIGGLIKEKTLWNDKNVWLLSSIPLIGNSFKHKREQKLRTDLSIFITPHIVEDRELEKPAQLDYPPIKDEIQSNKVTDKEKSDKKRKIRPDQDVSKKDKTSDTVLTYSMKDYFPFKHGRKWNYLWNESDVRYWETIMELSGPKVKDSKERWVMIETINDGTKSNNALSGYYWSKKGLYHYYRTSMNGDSVRYRPARLVIPRKMQMKKRYKSSYHWEAWDGETGKVAGSGTVEQIQRIIGEYNIVTETGSFQKCAAVETIWYEKGSDKTKKEKKIIWYAPDVGPVKVENSISGDSKELKGKISALLSSG